jgi:hypothetical protein
MGKLHQQRNSKEVRKKKTEGVLEALMKFTHSIVGRTLSIVWDFIFIQFIHLYSSNISGCVSAHAFY